jgi:hypothetical protein
VPSQEVLPPSIDVRRVPSVINTGSDRGTPGSSRSFSRRSPPQSVDSSHIRHEQSFGGTPSGQSKSYETGFHSGRTSNGVKNVYHQQAYYSGSGANETEWKDRNDVNARRHDSYQQPHQYSHQERTLDYDSLPNQHATYWDERNFSWDDDRNHVNSSGSNSRQYGGAFDSNNNTGQQYGGTFNNNDNSRQYGGTFNNNNSNNSNNSNNNIIREQAPRSPYPNSFSAVNNHSNVNNNNRNNNNTFNNYNYNQTNTNRNTNNQKKW